ncbi:MAG: DUF1697 domain-containing protein [Frankiales bacterium]|nr:DUF1697 domain-containing protein [Frankiales bacterium]
MAVHVALLRAVNVGGRKLPMADLRNILTDLGATAVRTYVQSGNVVFDSPAVTADKLAGALTRHCGFEVRVLLRSAADLRRVVAKPPLDGPETAWHVTFLAATPAAAAVRALDPSAYGEDTFRVVGKEVYLRTPGGYGRTKLTNALFEKKLAVAATTRNWRTVTTLAEMAADG